MTGMEIRAEVQPFDRVGRARTLPLADGQPSEGEQTITGLLEAVGYRFAFEPPLRMKARRRTSISTAEVA
jgi:hypothetical protein